MVYRIALHSLEWLAVSAATFLAAAWYVGAGSLALGALAAALICASLLRGISFRRVRTDQLDAMVSRFLAPASGRPANDGRRP